MPAAVMLIGLIIYFAVGVVAGLLTMAGALGLLLMWWLAGLGSARRVAKWGNHTRPEPAPPPHPSLWVPPSQDLHLLMEMPKAPPPTSNDQMPASLPGIPLPRQISSTQEAPLGINGKTKIPGWVAASVVIGILLLIGVPVLVLVVREKGVSDVQRPQTATASSEGSAPHIPIDATTKVAKQADTDTGRSKGKGTRRGRRRERDPVPVKMEL